MKIRIGVFALLFANLAIHAATVIDLGTLGGRAEGSAINGAGQVAGLMEGLDEFSHIFVYQDGRTQFIPLDGGQSPGLNHLGHIASATLFNNYYWPAIYSNGRVIILGSLGGNIGGVVGSATAINNLGAAVGYAYLPSGRYHAFLRNGDEAIGLRDLGCPADTPCSSYPTGINDSSDIVGYISANGTLSAFLYSNRVMRELKPIKGGWSEANAINNLGQIVGSYTDQITVHAFLYDHGTTTTLPASILNPNSSAYGINDNGDIVGSTGGGSAGQSRAFLYSKGIINDLNLLLPTGTPWLLTEAFGINKRGDIVGTGIVDGSYHAFLFQP